MSVVRLLIKPTLFTAGVCGTCFCGAAILSYENRNHYPIQMPKWYNTLQQRHLQQNNVLHSPDWYTTTKERYRYKYLDFRQKVNDWANNLSTGKKIALCTIFANVLVLGAWKVNRFSPVMVKYFLNRVSTSSIPLTPMILSCFSHSSATHLGFNMLALYSFSDVLTSLLGPEQLIALFLSAGAVSSLTSVAGRLAFKRFVPSLGASGALLGVISYFCCKHPEMEIRLFFIPVLAGYAIKTLLVVDFIGVVLKWGLFDHAAHLGGTLFGMWYVYYGQELYYKHRVTIVKEWKKLKTKYD